MSKFYIDGPDDGGEGVYTLLHESGPGLASHFCSSSVFAPSDLILARPERMEDYAVLFGSLEPIEIEFLANMTKEDSDAVAAKNVEWWKGEVASGRESE
jgi:hypothetical protein